MIYKLVARVIQYFHFFWETYERWGHLGFLEWGGGILEKGRYDPLTNYEFSWGFGFYNNWWKTLFPIVTLSIEDNAKLSKLLSEWFKRPVYWNKYKIIPNKTYNENDYIRELLDASYQGVKRLFVLAYRDCGGANRVTADSHRRYFLPRVKIDIYNIEIDGRNFYD